MKEILYILIAFAIFMSLVYAYAIYATKNGMSNDENNNFIHHSKCFPPDTPMSTVDSDFKILKYCEMTIS